MQLDVEESTPASDMTYWFHFRIAIGNCHSRNMNFFLVIFFLVWIFIKSQTDRRKVMYKSPPCIRTGVLKNISLGIGKPHIIHLGTTSDVSVFFYQKVYFSSFNDNNITSNQGKFIRGGLINTTFWATPMKSEPYINNAFGDSWILCKSMWGDDAQLSIFNKLIF